MVTFSEQTQTNPERFPRLGKPGHVQNLLRLYGSVQPMLGTEFSDTYHVDVNEMIGRVKDGGETRTSKHYDQGHPFLAFLFPGQEPGWAGPMDVSVYRPVGVKKEPYRVNIKGANNTELEIGYGERDSGTKVKFMYLKGPTSKIEHGNDPMRTWSETTIRFHDLSDAPSEILDQPRITILQNRYVSSEKLSYQIKYLQERENATMNVISAEKEMGDKGIEKYTPSRPFKMEELSKEYGWVKKIADSLPPDDTIRARDLESVIPGLMNAIRKNKLSQPSPAASEAGQA